MKEDMGRVLYSLRRDDPEGLKNMRYATCALWGLVILGFTIAIISFQGMPFRDPYLNTAYSWIMSILSIIALFLALGMSLMKDPLIVYEKGIYVSLPWGSRYYPFKQIKKFVVQKVIYIGTKDVQYIFYIHMNNGKIHRIGSIDKVFRLPLDGTSTAYVKAKLNTGDIPDTLLKAFRNWKIHSGSHLYIENVSDNVWSLRGGNERYIIQIDDNKLRCLPLNSGTYLFLKALYTIKGLKIEILDEPERVWV